MLYKRTNGAVRRRCFFQKKAAARRKERFRTALGSAPEDFRAVIKDWMLLTEATLPGKGKGKRR